MATLQDFLFVMAQEHMDFRMPELTSICDMLFQNSDTIKDHDYTDISPIFACKLESDEIALAIAQRSVLLKIILRLLNRAPNFQSILNEIRITNKNQTYDLNDTFKIDIYTFGKIYSQTERVAIIEELISALDFDEKKIKVCLNESLVKHRFFYVEDWIETKDNEKSTRTLRGCYFGKFLCYGQNTLCNKYNLKDRGFIGNTSMDPQLALIMANMAQCNEHKLVYDPFVGTGSLLVGAAHFGAHVAGADLDFNLIHSRGLSSRAGQKYRRKDQTIHSNLKQYGLESAFINTLVADFSQQYIRSDFRFDAIITDPPYGIREKTKRVDSKETANQATDMENKWIHSKKAKYQLEDIYKDLVLFGVQHLNEGGRLVFWLPVYLEESDRKSMRSADLSSCLRSFVPIHPGMELLSVSEQRLNRTTSRILITMEKSTDIHTNDVDIKFGAVADDGERVKSCRLNEFRDKYFSVKK